MLSGWIVGHAEVGLQLQELLRTSRATCPTGAGRVPARFGAVIDSFPFPSQFRFAPRPLCEWGVNRGTDQRDFLFETSCSFSSPALSTTRRYIGRCLPNWAAENGCILANGERQLSIHVEPALRFQSSRISSRTYSLGIL